ncbi:unnamed protein product [Bursaphelenchus okinawaensis]|uniref:Uncharacterized protein n=1 Tax=Bursaphelenchus okinawaensis TaxID=465554 RepID=A0A811L9J4_9BILA|nr:unnamed protein product [Bursaphelenchus okinawaensis]CAG9118813.1 unnamed protein product [Bursaphelenchus okinawaensis]
MKWYIALLLCCLVQSINCRPSYNYEEYVLLDNPSIKDFPDAITKEQKPMIPVEDSAEMSEEDEEGQVIPTETPVEKAEAPEEDGEGQLLPTETTLKESEAPEEETEATNCTIPLESYWSEQALLFAFYRLWPLMTNYSVPIDTMINEVHEDLKNRVFMEYMDPESKIIHAVDNEMGIRTLRFDEVNPDESLVLKLLNGLMRFVKRLVMMAINRGKPQVEVTKEDYALLKLYIKSKYSDTYQEIVENLKSQRNATVSVEQLQSAYEDVGGIAARISEAKTNQIPSSSSSPASDSIGQDVQHQILDIRCWEIALRIQLHWNVVLVESLVVYDRIPRSHQHRSYFDASEECWICMKLFGGFLTFYIIRHFKYSH